MQMVFGKVRLALASLVFVLAGCVETPGQDSVNGSKILAMGDSMMAWNSAGGRSVAHVIEQQLQTEVIDRSVPGARVIYNLPISGALGFRISEQYLGGDWDWIVMNGGGNDLLTGCGCTDCDKYVDRLLTKDARGGKVADLVTQLNRTGANILFLGYLRTPGRSSPIENCAAIGSEYENRLATLAERHANVFFLSNKDVVPMGDLSYHAADRIHPSAKGSAAIGRRAAALIAQLGL